MYFSRFFTLLLGRRKQSSTNARYNMKALLNLHSSENRFLWAHDVNWTYIRPGSFLIVLCTFNLRPVSMGLASNNEAILTYWTLRNTFFTFYNCDSATFKLLNYSDRMSLINAFSAGSLKQMLTFGLVSSKVCITYSRCPCNKLWRRSQCLNI